MLVWDASWKEAITGTPLGKRLLRGGGIQTLGEFGYEGWMMRGVS